jgi:orotate phosphoribosyltransferase
VRDTLNRMVDYHGSAVYEDPQRLVDGAFEDLAEVDFDTMVGMGLSGALVVPVLARALGKHWVIVRKEGVKSHSTFSRLAGELGQRWIFVDDFVGVGGTRAEVMKAITEDVERHNGYAYEGDHFETTYVGTYMYARGLWQEEP